MAYTNGVFYIDLVSGSDAARAALTSCVASNPSGSVTRINKNAHGLVTGAVVDLTLFTAWLNGAWKITVVDANNFDLDTAVWQTTADANGTVTPRGGTHADPWLTVTTGATTARIQPGDELRVEKATGEVSAGVDGTFTFGSLPVTLSAPLTKTIDNAAGSSWTVSANITQASQTTRKIGANALVLTPAAAFTTGKMAYKTLSGAQDFSAYSKVCFWFRPTSATAIAANTFKFCLCSDTTGDTIVNNISIPATINSTSFHAFTVDFGSALGSSIQSIAIYANFDPGVNAISFNNIFACNDFDLNTLFGTSGDVVYAPMYIDGTEVGIENNNNSVVGKGYNSATNTSALYYIKPFAVPLSTGTWSSVSEAGNSISQKNKISGGWDLSTQTQDGNTAVISRISGTGAGIGLNRYWSVERFTLARFANPVSISFENQIRNVTLLGGGALASTTASLFAENVKFLNNGAAQTVSGVGVTYKDCLFAGSSSQGASGLGDNEYLSCTFKNNTTSSVFATSGVKRGTGSPLFRNCTFEDTTEVGTNADYDCYLWSFNHDNTAGNHWGFTFGSTINWQTSVVHGTEPGAWKVAITSTNRSQYWPVTVEIPGIAVVSGSPVTVSLWVKKDHATNVSAILYSKDEGYALAGMVADTATKADDTNWQQLTVSFTPTESGVTSVFVDVYATNVTSANVYIGAIDVTQ